MELEMQEKARAFVCIFCPAFLKLSQICISLPARFKRLLFMLRELSGV